MIQRWLNYNEVVSVRNDDIESANVFECIVLGCVDPNRLQYAIYAKEIGLEHRYLSERGSLNVGETIWLKVASVNPRNGLLSLSLASKASGVASQSARAA